MALLAFKIMDDPFVGSITFCRIYSGRLDSGSGGILGARNCDAAIQALAARDLDAVHKFIPFRKRARSRAMAAGKMRCHVPLCRIHGALFPAPCGGTDWREAQPIAAQAWLGGRCLPSFSGPSC